jgi:hypothetical protein
MSTIPYDYLRLLAQEPENAEQARRRKGIFETFLERMPEERQKLVDEGQRQGARKAVRNLLAVRGLALAAGDEARIDGCTDLSTLDRWHDQAIVAATVAEALR